MKCPICGKDLDLQNKQIGTSENGDPIFNEYAITYPRRSWNKYIEVKNQSFCDGETDMYIAHSNKGYKITKSKDEIEASIKHLDTMALNMLSKESKVKKALNRSVNNG